MLIGCRSRTAKASISGAAPSKNLEEMEDVTPVGTAAEGLQPRGRRRRRFRVGLDDEDAARGEEGGRPANLAFRAPVRRADPRKSRRSARPTARGRRAPRRPAPRRDGPARPARRAVRASSRAPGRRPRPRPSRAAPRDTASRPTAPLPRRGRGSASPAIRSGPRRSKSASRARALTWAAPPRGRRAVALSTRPARIRTQGGRRGGGSWFRFGRREQETQLLDLPELRVRLGDPLDLDEALTASRAGGRGRARRRSAEQRPGREQVRHGSARRGASGDEEEALEALERRAQRRRSRPCQRRELVEPDRPAASPSGRASVTAEDCRRGRPSCPVRRSSARSSTDLVAAEEVAVELELRRREALALDLVLRRRGCVFQTSVPSRKGSGGRSPRWTAGSTRRRTWGRTRGRRGLGDGSRRDGRGEGEDERGAHRRLRAAASAKASSSAASIRPSSRAARVAASARPMAGPGGTPAATQVRARNGELRGAPRKGFEEDAAVPRSEKRRRGEDLVGGEPGDETPAFRGREPRESGGQPPTRPGPARGAPAPSRPATESRAATSRISRGVDSAIHDEKVAEPRRAEARLRPEPLGRAGKAAPGAAAPRGPGPGAIARSRPRRRRSAGAPRRSGSERMQCQLPAQPVPRDRVERPRRDRRARSGGAPRARREIPAGWRSAPRGRRAWDRRAGDAG